MALFRRFLTGLLLLYAVIPVWADEAKNNIKPAVPLVEIGFIAKIELNTAEEIEEALKKAEQYLDSADKYPDFQPITFILHGPEVQVFARKNYQKYKHIVGLAARLEAFNVIDVRVCEIQLRVDDIQQGDLPAFVETVPYGPAEEKRLLRKGYQYF